MAENGRIENEYTIIANTSQLLGLNSFGRLRIKQAAIKLMQTPSTLKYTLLLKTDSEFRSKNLFSKLCFLQTLWSTWKINTPPSTASSKNKDSFYNWVCSIVVTDIFKKFFSLAGITWGSDKRISSLRTKSKCFNFKAFETFLSF